MTFTGIVPAKEAGRSAVLAAVRRIERETWTAPTVSAGLAEAERRGIRSVRYDVTGGVVRLYRIGGEWVTI